MDWPEDFLGGVVPGMGESVTQAKCAEVTDWPPLLFTTVRTGFGIGTVRHEDGFMNEYLFVLALFASGT